MTDPDTNPNAGVSETHKVLAAIGWPGLVVVLLLGHATVMMVAMTLGRTIPAALTTVDPPAIESRIAGDPPDPRGPAR